MCPNWGKQVISLAFVHSMWALFLVCVCGLALALPQNHWWHCPALPFKWSMVLGLQWWIGSRDFPLWCIKVPWPTHIFGGAFTFVYSILSHLLPHCIPQLPIGHMGLLLLVVLSFGHPVCGLMRERWLFHSFWLWLEKSFSKSWFISGQAEQHYQNYFWLH